MSPPTSATTSVNAASAEFFADSIAFASVHESIFRMNAFFISLVIDVLSLITFALSLISAFAASFSSSRVVSFTSSCYFEKMLIEFFSYNINLFFIDTSYLYLDYNKYFMFIHYIFQLLSKKAGNEKTQNLFIHPLFTYTLTTTTSTTSGCSTTHIPQNTTCFSASVY